MTWEKLPPYQSAIHQGCPHCPPIERLAPLDMLIGVGFGYAVATKDGDLIFSESSRGPMRHYYDSKLAQLLIYLSTRKVIRWEGLPILADIEELARENPDHDWRVILDAPLRGRAYQRHGPGQWILIKSNGGFA
jgi:hypothetical protein